MLTVTDNDFSEKVLESAKPVLVDFYSDSCIPCKRMSPILGALSEEYTDIEIVKLNVNFSPETPKQYNVLSSPTLIFFKDGKEVKRIKGVADEDTLADAIEEVLA